MRNPNTADERERRIVAYLVTLHQGRLSEFKLTRMNRIANFRKQLIQLIDEMIEVRAEDLAATMLMQFAEPRPAPIPHPHTVIRRKRRLPPWIGEAHRREKSA
jgi:hypothetical protein